MWMRNVWLLIVVLILAGLEPAHAARRGGRGRGAANAVRANNALRFNRFNNFNNAFLFNRFFNPFFPFVGFNRPVVIPFEGNVINPFANAIDPFSNGINPFFGSADILGSGHDFGPRPINTFGERAVDQSTDRASLCANQIPLTEFPSARTIETNCSVTWQNQIFTADGRNEAWAITNARRRACEAGARPEVAIQLACTVIR